MSMNEQQLLEAMGYMDAGVFLDKVRAALSETVVNVVAHGDKGKVGKVSIEFKIERQGDTHQVNISHKLTHTRPTSSGKVSEETARMTPFYVESGGVLVFFNPAQGKLGLDQKSRA